MIDMTTAEPRRLWHSRRFRAAVLAVGIFLALVSLFIWRYSTHLAWKFQEAWSGLTRDKPVPTQPMPEAAIPPEWVRVRAGPIELSMPAELAKSLINRRGDGRIFMFRDESVMIDAIPDRSGSDGLVEMLDAATQLDPQRRTFTLPKLLVEFHRTGADNFRWSMTPEEVRWHAYCMSNGRIARLNTDHHAEFLSRPGWDGFVSISDKLVSLSWQAVDRKAGGAIHFGGKNINRPDLSLVRAICQSITLAEEPTP